MTQAKIAIVILNWNGRDDTLECLKSVLRIDYPNFEVIVIDNGSTDDSVPAIRSVFPQVHLIETGKNLGYAGGNNAGIRYALDNHYDAILLLNNDTTVGPGILSAFSKAMSDHPDGAVFGAKIFYTDPPDVLWFAGGFWKDDELTFIHRGQGEKDGSEYSMTIHCDYITGCALFAPTQVFRKIGLLDERFFLTYEETDWCYRARIEGYPCIYTPDALVWHKVSASFGGEISPLNRYFMTRNQLLWAKKHLPTSLRFHLQRKTIWNIVPEFKLSDETHYLPKRIIWGATSWLLQLRHRLNHPLCKAELAGIRDYYLGRYGDCPPGIRKLTESYMENRQQGRSS